MTNKKRVLFISHDPGGYNLLSAIIDEPSIVNFFDVHVLLAGHALKKNREKKLSHLIVHEIQQFPFKGYPNEWDVNMADVETIINEVRPDVILTGTSINSNIERYGIHIGNLLAIPTLSYIDSWIGENIRFKSALIETFPRYIMVCDEMMGELYKGLKWAASKIVNVGNPHLDRLCSEINTAITKIEPEENRVLFFAENMYHYYPEGKLNELQIIKSILENYQSDRKIRIAIRPHPLESKDHWNKFIYEHKGSNPVIDIFLDDITSLRDSIYASSIVFGISSTALIEASILGKKTLSYQVGINGDKELLYIPFDFFGIIENSNLDEICAYLSNNLITDLKPCKYVFSNAIENVKKLINIL